MSPSITRIFDLLEVVSARPDEQIMFSSARNGQWQDYTAADYLRYADLTSHALLRYGITKGEPVLSITHNRAEFNFVDMGILQTGALHVPLYPAVDVGKLERIIAETGARVAFISNRSVLRKIRQIPSCTLQLIVSFDTTEGAVTYEDFLLTADESKGTDSTETLLSRKVAVQPDDPASIIYLSGSNTPLKGVVLTHAAHVFNLLNYCKLHHFEGCSHSISFLPLAHSFERTVNYSFQNLGIRVTYNEGIATLAGILKQNKPDVMLAVPLVLERIIETVKNEMLKTEGIKGRMAVMALRWAAHEKAGPGRKRFSLKNMVYSRAFEGLRNFLGGNIKVMLCGGAALRPESLNILWAAGINTYEGYGLTEAGPLVSYNLYHSFKSQSVGKLMPGVEVKIAPDQEVLVRSGGLMKGYFMQKTSPIDTDGWLHTGDFGTMDKQGFLTLTGTKKDIFKLSSGLYTDPGPVESLLSVLLPSRKVWVYGHNQSFLTALIAPGIQQAGESFIPETEVSADNSVNIDESQSSLSISQAISDYNAACPKYDQIIKFEVVQDEWTVGNGLLHSDGSLNRQALARKYQGRIDRMYSLSLVSG